MSSVASQLIHLGDGDKATGDTSSLAAAPQDDFPRSTEAPDDKDAQGRLTEGYPDAAAVEDLPAAAEIRHVPASRLEEFRRGLIGKKLLFAKGFSQFEKGPLDSFDGFLKHNNPAMLKEIQATVLGFGLTRQDFVVIDGDPVNAGFQIFVRWICGETGCQLIWAKKLPATSLSVEKQEEQKAKMWNGVNAWKEELKPFGTTIHFVEISHEAQEVEMLRMFGKGLLDTTHLEATYIDTSTGGPRYNAPITFSVHSGEMQRLMDQEGANHPIVEAFKGFSQRGPMELNVFENGAKGLVIRSLLRPYAESNLTLLIGGGPTSLLEAAACLLLGQMDADKELAVFAASRGKPETDPELPSVRPVSEAEQASCQ